MMLDATAGNRSLWSNKFPPNVIFLDKESDLKISPDIIADNTQCPFRDDVFDVVLFDPPWGINLPPWFLNKKFRSGNGGINYYGNFKTKRELFKYIHDAQNEFKRITDRLCLKWGERDVSLWNILPFFNGWKIIHKREHRSLKNAQGKSMNVTWWVTFKLKSDSL